MIERICSYLEAFNDLLEDREYKKKFVRINFSEEDIQNLTAITQVFQYFHDATCILSGSKCVTLSVVFPIFKELRSNMQPTFNDTEMKAFLKSYLLRQLDKYCLKYNINENNEFLLTASFLDIRTKLFGETSINRRAEYTKKCIEAIKSVIPESQDPCGNQTQSNVCVRDERQRLRIFDFNKNINSNNKPKKRGPKSQKPNHTLSINLEVENYEKEVGKDIDPIDFWKANMQMYPILYKAFLFFMAIPATSVPSERLFSHAGYNVWDRRNRISDQNVEKMMMIYENLNA
jgi:hypothetical protein